MKPGKRLWAIVLIMTAVVILFLLTYFILTRMSQNSLQSGSEQGVIAKIVSNPSSYTDNEVIVMGRIEDILSERIFTVSDNRSPTLVVLIPSELTSEQQASKGEYISPSAQVRVVGRVEQLSFDMVESRYDIELDSTQADALNDQPMLIASSITFSDKNNNVWEFEYPSSLN